MPALRSGGAREPPNLFGNLVARMAAWCHTEPDDLCRPDQGPTAGRRPGSACGRT